MISLHNVSAAGEALQYFSQDNYYTEHEGLEESRWFGKGAAALGFEGKVDKSRFFETLAGEIDGQQLGKIVRNEESGEQEREHRPGTDITFSAPKSVSLLAEVYGSREVREAHEGAVQAALGYMERELAQTRQMTGGQLEAVKTGNLTVAMFRHNTSRDLDPQTHTHAIIMNATKREDGQWRSLTNDEIFKSQRVIGAIYTGELAYRLQALGYELRRSDDRGNFEIAGITREQIEHFSQRRAGIEAELEARGIDPKFATAQEKESATLSTRARKVDVDHVELIKTWKERAASVGIDFEAIQAHAVAARERGGVPRDDRLTGRGAMEFAAAHLIEREAVVSKIDLMQAALEHGAGRVSPREVEKAFNKLERDGDLVKLPDANYTTKKMLGSEQWALDQVRDTKGQGVRILGEATIAERLTAAEKRLGITYTDGQREAITKSLASHDRFIAVQGLAGTGKTTMLKALNQLATEQGYQVRGMAPTGAASKVLGRETGIVAETVSMFEIKERQLQRDIAFAQQHAPEFRRKQEIWVVDEGSFLSQRQMARLHHMAIIADARVIYLGDTLQLQGVEAGKPFEMAQRNGIETAYMTEINRQKTPELRQVVDIITGRDQVEPDAKLTEVRLENNARAFAYLDQVGRVKEFKESDAVAELVKDIAAMAPAERARTIVITAYNKDRHAINEGVRAGLKERGELSASDAVHEVFESKGWTRAVIREAQYYKAGDVVRFGRDYKVINAAKGEYMRVLGADQAQPWVVRLQKTDGSTVSWEPRKNNNVEVYDADRRGIAVGDLIRFNRTEGDLKNGEVARVRSLDGALATVELGKVAGGESRQLDLSKNKHWDHAYAQTVHASQGSTEHRTLFHIRAPESANERRLENELQAMTRVFGDRSFYVGTTRASHEIEIYTNDKTVAARAVAGRQDKTSAVQTLQRHAVEQSMPAAQSQAPAPRQGPTRSQPSRGGFDR